MKIKKNKNKIYIILLILLIIIGGYIFYKYYTSCKSNSTDGTVENKCDLCKLPKCKEDNLYCNDSNVCKYVLHKEMVQLTVHATDHVIKLAMMEIFVIILKFVKCALHKETVRLIVHVMDLVIKLAMMEIFVCTLNVLLVVKEELVQVVNMIVINLVNFLIHVHFLYFVVKYKYFIIIHIQMSKHHTFDKSNKNKIYIILLFLLIIIFFYFYYHYTTPCKSNSTDGTIGNKCDLCGITKCKDANAYCDSSNVCKACLTQGNGNVGSACGGPCDKVCNDGTICNTFGICECTSQGDGSLNSKCGGPCDKVCYGFTYCIPPCNDCAGEKVCRYPCNNPCK